LFVNEMNPESVTASVSIVGMGMQTFYSIQHIQSAAYHAWRAGKLERRYDGSSTSPVRTAILTEAGSALFSAVAFLEATANELFADAAELAGGHLNGVDPDRLALIAQLGVTESVDRAGVAAKFDILLTAAGAQPLNRGTQPSQAIMQVIALRNGLTHYKASWLDVGTEHMVRPKNFATSKLAGELRFPSRKHAGSLEGDGWIGYGCARWAVESVLLYAGEVFGRLGVKPIYEHVRGELRY
jgi:hypothetical protein